LTSSFSPQLMLLTATIVLNPTRLHKRYRNTLTSRLRVLFCGAD